MQVLSPLALLQAGTHPSPGTVMTNQGGGNAQIVGPTVSEGTMNEFRFLDPPANTTALSVLVTAGQPFVVSLTFFSQSSGGAPFLPAPTIDQDGCQAGSNAADVIPGGWNVACLLGVTGDFVIRALVDCQAAATPTSSGWAVTLLIVSIAGAVLVVWRRAAV